MVLNSTQRSGGESSNLFCLLDDEIPSGIGLEQVICLESLYLKKAFSRYVEKYTPLQLSRAALPVY